jgi:hypothetical protein
MAAPGIVQKPGLDIFGIRFPNLFGVGCKGALHVFTTSVAYSSVSSRLDSQRKFTPETAFMSTASVSGSPAQK